MSLTEKILITGACGYVGRALIGNCRRENLITLDRVRNEKVEQNCANFLFEDLNEITPGTQKFLSKFHGIVIHLAAARVDDALKEVYLRDNINSTKLFLDTLDPQKVTKFIHVGSVAAIDGEKIAKNEFEPTNSDDWYRLTKFQQQQMVENWAVKYRVPLIVLAPSAIYDANARDNETNIGRLEKIVTQFPIVPRINSRKSLTSMSLINSAIVASCKIEMQRENPCLERYIVIDQPILTVTEICERKFNVKYVVKIPFLYSILKSSAKILELTGLEKTFSLTVSRVEKLFTNTVYTADENYSEWKYEQT